MNISDIVNQGLKTKDPEFQQSILKLYRNEKADV